MNAFIISDKDYQTESFHRLDELVRNCLKEKGFKIEHREIGRKDITNCIGCFGCWVKEPGECVIKDGMAEINNKCMNSDVVVYLSPVIFGQFSANLKNVIDRWLPNMLPFFMLRPDGSTIHPARYKTYPMQFMIGYGDAVSQEDAQLFVDITKKHRTNVEALIFQGDGKEIVEAFNQKELKRVSDKL